MRMRMFLRLACVAALIFCAAARLSAAPTVIKLAPNLYAYISDNDASSNSTFLIGRHGILVVDTGVNVVEGEKLLSEIRKISPLPVEFIINTHYHLDHQGGNEVVGPHAMVISSSYTRMRTLEMMAATHKQNAQNKNAKAIPARPPAALRPATVTTDHQLTVYLDDDPAEIFFAGPAHTMGDVYVYFPKQRTVATGDLYLTRSSPAMDQGSAAHWVRDLDAILALPADHFVPGHFELGTRATITRFREYLADLTAQVTRLYRAGATLRQVLAQINMKPYADFRQFPQFQATFADNATTIYHQLQQSHQPRGKEK